MMNNNHSSHSRALTLSSMNKLSCMNNRHNTNCLCAKCGLPLHNPNYKHSMHDHYHNNDTYNNKNVKSQKSHIHNHKSKQLHYNNNPKLNKATVSNKGTNKSTKRQNNDRSARNINQGSRSILHNNRLPHHLQSFNHFNEYAQTNRNNNKHISVNNNIDHNSSNNKTMYNTNNSDYKNNYAPQPILNANYQLLKNQLLNEKQNEIDTLKQQLQSIQPNNANNTPHNNNNTVNQYIDNNNQSSIDISNLSKHDLLLQFQTQLFNIDHLIRNTSNEASNQLNAANHLLNQLILLPLTTQLITTFNSNNVNNNRNHNVSIIDNFLSTQKSLFSQLQTRIANVRSIIHSQYNPSTNKVDRNIQNAHHNINNPYHNKNNINNKDQFAANSQSQQQYYQQPQGLTEADVLLKQIQFPTYSNPNYHTNKPQSPSVRQMPSNQENRGDYSNNNNSNRIRANILNPQVLHSIENLPHSQLYNNYTNENNSPLHIYHHHIIVNKSTSKSRKKYTDSINYQNNARSSSEESEPHSVESQSFRQQSNNTHKKQSKQSKLHENTNNSNVFASNNNAASNNNSLPTTQLLQSDIDLLDAEIGSLHERIQSIVAKTKTNQQQQVNEE